MTYKYRGYKIVSVDYQDCRNYRIPEIYGRELALSLKMAQEWIDAYLYEAAWDRTFGAAIQGVSSASGVSVGRE